MSICELIATYPWSLYSKELIRRIENPQCEGKYTPEDAQARGMFLAVGISGSFEESNVVKIYSFVDESDAVIADACFQAFGESILIGVADAACENMIGKNYDQAQRMGPLVIKNTLKDSNSISSSFPENMTSYLDLVLESISNTMEQCKHIPLPQSYTPPSSPFEKSSIECTGGYPDWETLTKEKKCFIIEQVLDENIRPFIAMDNGGVELLDIIDGKEVIIAYNGSCTSCFSAVGATLSYIQETICAKVYKDLVVVPDMKNMDLPWK